MKNELSFPFKSPEDVTKMGIANYNQECRKIVMRYSKEWEVRQKNGLKQLLLSCT